MLYGGFGAGRSVKVKRLWPSKDQERFVYIIDIYIYIYMCIHMILYMVKWKGGPCGGGDDHMYIYIHTNQVSNRLSLRLTQVLGGRYG